MATNTTAALKLLPNTIHCVKTGLPLVNFAAPNALAKLNAGIKDGRIECGTAVGRILIAEGSRPVGSKNFRWKQYSRTKGQWLVFTGGKIGDHNEAVLVENGLTADPDTRSKGTVGNRQYGVYNEPKVVKQPSTMTTFLGGNEVTITTETNADLLEREDCPQPSTMEMQGTGSYGKWVSKCKGLGFNRKEANDAWKAAKAALQAKPTVKATPSKPAKAEPTANAKQGTVLQVHPAALQSVLANIGEAKVDYNPATEMFTVSM